MKAKKAVKRLGKVETLLSNVIDQYAKSVDSVRELLDVAKASVVRAVEAVNLHSSTAAPKKPPVKAQEPKRRGLSAAGRKKLSIAAKKRWAIAKRKGVSAVTGRPLSKTA
jgi:hypothetical protein